jgi:hypothetical protein
MCVVMYFRAAACRSATLGARHGLRRPRFVTPHPMSHVRTFLGASHVPTLFAAFLYFAFSCCIWMLNGAMAPFISETFQHTPAQKGLMLSIPIFAVALMRLPLGVLAQHIRPRDASCGAARWVQTKSSLRSRGPGWLMCPISTPKLIQRLSPGAIA